jgi:hypothetical protein
MQVLEDEHGRLLIAEPTQHAEHRLEQAPLVGMAVLCPDSGIGHELGQQSSQLAATRPDGPRQLSRVEVVGEGSQRLDDGGVRQDPLAEVQTATPQDQAAARFRRARELGEEARFADPSLARDQDGGRLSAPCA